MRLELPYIPPGSNQLHRMHYQEVAAWRRQLRRDVSLLATPIDPLMHRATVTLELRWRTKHHRDAQNYVEGLKGAIDGLKGRWLTDDDDLMVAVVARVGTGEPDRVILTVEERP